MSTPRTRLVIDPVWHLIDEAVFVSSFGRLVKEARFCGFVGLDLEWTTTQREVAAARETESGDGVVKRTKTKRIAGPVATVQLSSSSTTIIVKYCDLVGLHEGTLVDPLLPHSREWRHHRMGASGNSPALVARVLGEVNAVLADRTIAKVGVGVFGDKIKMESDYGGRVSVERCVDLVALADHYLAGQDVTPHGATSAVPVRRIRSLKAMCNAFAARPLDKDHFVVCSAWGSGLGALSPLQVQYAAADAEASFDACAGILAAAGVIGDWSPTSPPPACHEHLAPLIGEPAPRQLPTKAVQNVSTCTRTTPATTEESEDWCKGRERPYYDNINVFDPDMNLVFTVDRSKAEWYVQKKGLATVVEWRTADAASPGTGTDRESGDEGVGGAAVEGERVMAAIQLCFAPDFRKYNDAHIRRNMDYFRQPKENVCVVCGSGDKLVRFAVVPLMYRKYFPSVYMSHNSYDLLLLCTSCFSRSRAVYEAEKAAIAEDFGIPIGHLTSKTTPQYDARIAEKEASLEADSAAFQRDPNNTTAHHLHPLQVLNAMREYRELQRHRECIMGVFKYAKALGQHYIFDESPDQSDEGQLSSQAALLRRCGSRRTRKKPVRWDADRAPTRLPAARFKELCDYVDTHAPAYPFYDATLSSQAEQDAIFTERQPSSREGVELIMTGRASLAQRGSEDCPVADTDVSQHDSVDTAAERSYHSVLTQYWLQEHPDLVTLLPTTTREEEKKRGQPTTTSPDDEEMDTDKVLHVDNHGFLVVKLLMQKYQDDTASGKTSEHAVGQFIYRWRTAFLSLLQPQHLPTGWVAEDGILQ